MTGRHPSGEQFVRHAIGRLHQHQELRRLHGRMGQPRRHSFRGVAGRCQTRGAIPSQTGPKSTEREMPGYFMGMVHGITDEAAFGAYQHVAEPIIKPIRRQDGLREFRRRSGRRGLVPHGHLPGRVRKQRPSPEMVQLPRVPSGDPPTPRLHRQQHGIH